MQKNARSGTSDGVRSFDYDASNRLAKVRLPSRADGEATTISYLHNGLGQRVFKSQQEAERSEPNAQELGEGFMDWLRRSFGAWLAGAGRERARLGQAFVYGDDQLPAWALLGEYDNGTAQGKGRTEYIWLPTEDGSAIPVGMYRGGRLYAIHSDHLGTPRLVTDAANKPVWQWPYSAFGDNQPTGVLRSKREEGDVRLARTEPWVELNLRFPGQYADAETGTFYNYFRDYDAAQGRYRSADPIGLAGGFNRFAYARGNPIKRVDLFGLIDGWTDPSGPPDMNPRPPINIVRGTPSDACTCSSGGKKFSAPPGANYGDVFRAGEEGGYDPFAIDAAVGHFGSYDFQRNYATNSFTGAYTDASNFSVGVYMRGAGFGRDQTIIIASTFERMMSTNAGAAAQIEFWKAGWDAANSGKLSGICK